jgi:hypothetical protein
MYVRTISRKNKDGSKVTYVQLAHNVWDKEKGYARAEVIYSFGRAEDLDIEAIRRLVKSLCRFLPPGDVTEVQAVLEGGGGEDIEFIKSYPMGGGYILRGLWERLGLQKVIAELLKGREFRTPVEWAIFTMVANRALAPSSKRAVEEWAREDVWLGNPEPVSLQHLYRAMDFLIDNEDLVQREVFFSIADLLNLEVDLLFFDTTSTYFELEEEDGDGLRRYGHSKDRRGDLPQVVIGLAVTKEGIPVRCWVLPGNTADMKTVEMVKEELRGWRLGRCIWVMDRGMNSEENRVILQRAGGHYIIGEKLRDASGKYKEALSCRGRYHKVRDNLMVKEVVIGEGERRRRFVVVYNPEQAKKDRAVREKTLERIEESLKAMRGKESKKAVCSLLTDRTMGRYLKQLKSGKVKIDRRKVTAEEALDGKYLLSTSDDSLSAEDVALGYKQLLEVERAFRTLKSTLDLRPVYHRKDERIKAHVLLCFLALLLVRIAELQTGLTWDRIRAEMERIHLGIFESKNGRILRRTELTSEQSKILKKLKISPPPKVYKVDLKG